MPSWSPRPCAHPYDLERPFPPRSFRRVAFCVQPKMFTWTTGISTRLFGAKTIRSAINPARLWAHPSVRRAVHQLRKGNDLRSHSVRLGGKASFLGDAPCKGFKACMPVLNYEFHVFVSIPFVYQCQSSGGSAETKEPQKKSMSNATTHCLRPEREVCKRVTCAPPCSHSTWFSVSFACLDRAPFSLPTRRSACALQ